MKKLDINITKAELVSFSVTAKKGEPEVSATIALMTEGGKTITTYNVTTHPWNDKDKLDIPVSALPLIGQLAVIIEEQAVKQCRDAQLGISAGTRQTEEVPF